MIIDIFLILFSNEMMKCVLEGLFFLLLFLFYLYSVCNQMKTKRKQNQKYPFLSVKHANQYESMLGKQPMKQKSSSRINRRIVHARFGGFDSIQGIMRKNGGQNGGGVMLA